MQLSLIEFRKSVMAFPSPADKADHHFTDIGIEFRIHTKEDEVDESMAVGVTAWDGKDKDASPSFYASFTVEEFNSFAQSIYALNLTLQEQRKARA